MAMLIKGVSVVLHEKTATANRDERNRVIYDEHEVTIDNVLIAPSTEQEITDSLNLTGRKAVYTLAIPKGDSHRWTDSQVDFFGKSFRVIGSPVEGIESLLPLDWNKKVRVENYE